MGEQQGEPGLLVPDMELLFRASVLSYAIWDTFRPKSFRPKTTLDLM